MRNRLVSIARPAGDRLIDLGVGLVLVGGLVLPIFTARALTGAPVLLNEMLVSHSGTDTTEFVELYGTPGHSLAGLSLVVVEGDSSGAGAIDLRVDFDADDRLGGNGFFLLGNATGLGANYGVVPDVALTPTSPAVELFENGSQTVALVETSSLSGSTVTGAETVVDSLGLNDGGFTETFFWGAPVFGPDDAFLPAGARRVTDGVDTDAASDWVVADDHLGPANTPTAATAYDAPPVASCEPSVTTTFGTAAYSPVSASDADGVVTTFSISADPDPGTLSVTDLASAGAAGEAATASVSVEATTPVGTYDVTITALTDATPPQEATCTLRVTVEEDLLRPPGDGSLADLLAAFDGLVADGSVDSRKAAELREHLVRSARFAERGMHESAAAQLRSFVNHVEGMSPRWVGRAAAADLSATARALLGG